MKLEVNLSSFSIIKAIVFSQLRNKAIWAMCIIPSILINGVSVVGLWAMGFPFQECLSVALDFINWIFGLFLAGLVLTVISLVCNPKWRRGRVGLHEIEINEKGLIESTQYNRSEIYWSSIHSASSKQDGIYFLHSGSDVFVIPRNSFNTEESWREFVNLFYSHYNKRKNA